MMQTLEERTDTGIALLGVEAHITHLKQLEWCYYSVVTVATPQHEEYKHLDATLAAIYLEGSIKHLNGSALDRLIVKRFARVGCGVAPCHATDQFSRERGRVIAKGRLLKYYRAYIFKPYVGVD
jgi:hypothetical protein